MARSRRKKATGTSQRGGAAKTWPKRGPNQVAKERLASLKVGSSYRVEIASVNAQGVSVHLGAGLLGFIPREELHWRRIGLPGPSFTVGQAVEAKVTQVDRQHGTVELSMRRLQPDPADDLTNHFRGIEWVLTRVHSLDGSKLFVRLPTGHLEAVPTDGLSEQMLGFLRPASELWLRVSGVDRSRRRVRLSAQAAPTKPVKTLPRELTVISEAAVRAWAEAGADAVTASRWLRAGWDLRHARPWLEAGILNVRAAEVWRAERVEPARAGPWRSHGPGKALPWIAQGVSPPNAAAADSMGLRPEIVGPFLRAKFSVEEAERLIRSGTSLESAIAKRTERKISSTNGSGPMPGWWHGGE